MQLSLTIIILYKKHAKSHMLHFIHHDTSFPRIKIKSLPHCFYNVPLIQSDCYLDQSTNITKKIQISININTTSLHYFILLVFYPKEII